MHNVSTSQLTLDGLLEKIKEVFSPELRLVKEVKINLICKEDTFPELFKVSFAPYAYKERIGKKIDRLIADGTLEAAKPQIMQLQLYLC